MRPLLLILSALLAGGGSLSADPPASFAERLAARGAIDIPLPEARALEARIGQLLVVNVDGFGWGGRQAVLPEFLTMVERLQLGGVIPHYGTTSFTRIRAANRALAGLTREPLLLCCDMVSLRAQGPDGTARTARFGDGYTGGFIGRFAGLRDEDFRALSELNARAFAAIGINTSLGPTVDDSTRDPRTAERARTLIDSLRGFGIEPVVKHFPFLPSGGADLHRESPDTRVPEPEVARRVGIFRELGPESGILMTTHTYDSLVDNGRIVTFSPRWNALLRNETGFRGLLMSDGLLMLRRYADKALVGTGDQTVTWAIRSILAGHDMIIVEGGSATTYRVFEGLLAAASRRSKTGRLLRSRIGESYERIVAFKREQSAALTETVEVPAPELRDLVWQAAALEEQATPSASGKTGTEANR